MRRFSIYLTLFFSKTAVSPTAVTLISIAAGLFGVWLLWYGRWFEGILWVNAWYLLDHVDGELARLTKKSSATGLFFDTLANAIVQPLSLYVIGEALVWRNAYGPWRVIGAVAAYGSLMMLLIPYCVDETLARTKKTAFSAAPREFSVARASWPKRVFMGLHQIITFPVILPVLTLAILAFHWVGPDEERKAVEVVLSTYAIVVTVVWTSILANLALTKKLDK